MEITVILDHVTCVYVFKIYEKFGASYVVVLMVRSESKRSKATGVAKLLRMSQNQR